MANPLDPPTQDSGRPRLVGRVGSLDAFWPLLEPILNALRPHRLCEIGVDQGIFTDRLLAWGKAHDCAYVGIDPAPDPAAAERIRHASSELGRSGASELVMGRSLNALRELAPCEAYFIDGDHNFYTVLHELYLIAHATARRPADAVGPVIFAHDVSWPFARRDMYHEPNAVPLEQLHPHSDALGVSLDGDELVAGGLRSPGRYAIALHAGGPRNGVLTAIEDFLASDPGKGWRSLVVPIAYGLAILYRPDCVSEPCRVLLDGLRTSADSMHGFLESCEANFLHLYLHAEDAQATYRQLETAYRALEGNYKNLTAHSETLLVEFNGLLGAYRDLESAFQRVSQERDALRERGNASAAPAVVPR